MAEVSVAVVLTEELSKQHYTHWSLKDVSLSVSEGELVLCMGPSRAGKTTLLRILMGYIKPTRGKVSVLGMDPRKQGHRIRERVGYVPAYPRFPGDMTGGEFLEYILKLKGLESGQANSLLERFNPELDRPLKRCGPEEIKKLAIIQAFVGPAELYFIDEPWALLERPDQEEFRSLLVETKRSGKTMLVASQAPLGPEFGASRVYLLDEGEIGMSGGRDLIKARYFKIMTVLFRPEGDEIPRPEDFFGPSVLDVERIPRTRLRFGDQGSDDLIGYRITIRGEIGDLLSRLADFPVVDIDMEEPPLEQMFADLYLDSGEGVGTDWDEEEEHYGT